MNPEILVERARLADVEAIKALLDDYARSEELLARSRLDLYESIRDFVVARAGAEVVGVSALHVCWIDLGEVRSLAVKRDLQRHGVGRQLVERCHQDAVQLGLRKVFALTYQPGFFAKLGYAVVEKSELPHKVWQVCLNCVKFPECDEIAVMREVTEPAPRIQVVPAGP